MDTIVETSGDSRVIVPVAGGQTSAVSWGAVAGGAFVIGALSLALLALGAGFGLSSVSPWPGSGVSMTTFGVMAAVWLVVVQWLSSAVGGYVTGRLRTMYTRLHTDEVYFRDTAHGVMAWAVAAVVGAAALATAATVLAGGVAAGATQGGAQATAQNGGSGGPTAYVADMLFRTDQPNAGGNAQDSRAEAARILAAAAAGSETSGDRAYLARVVTARTGVSQEDAQKRVDEAVTQVKAKADATRKATMQFSLLVGFSMLIGAFIAAIAARIGGHHRDDLDAV